MMVALGSGGAITGEEFILNRLPYAKGLQYEQLFWALRRVPTVSGDAEAIRQLI